MFIFFCCRPNGTVRYDHESTKEAQETCQLDFSPGPDSTKNVATCKKGKVKIVYFKIENCTSKKQQAS